MSPLRAHIIAARAYEAAWREQDEFIAGAFPALRPDISRSEIRLIHRRAAEIMEAEAAKEEEGEG